MMSMILMVAALSLPPQASDDRAALVQLTEEHDALKASALKLEMAFRGCFGEYIAASLKARQAASKIARCDKAYTARVAELDKCASADNRKWLGVPAWGWAIIGAATGAAAMSVVVIAGAR